MTVNDFGKVIDTRKTNYIVVKGDKFLYSSKSSDLYDEDIMDAEIDIIWYDRTREVIVVEIL